MAKVTAEVGVKISANEVAFKAALDRATSSISKFENRLKNTISVTGALSQALGAFSVYEITRQVINTTSEFQKLETVLGKTLGSSQLAAQSFEMITKFAQESPYQVQELTNVFVRWANLGLSPSIEKMRMLSDVASSLGAGFEQTGEAFKDLMVGQTKRLEEIGISAVQSNGKIQLSFKGVNIEIEKNAAGVMKALQTYSSLQGVQGASAAIMETLGGKTSNLNDKWTLLMYSIGQSTEGPLYWAIETFGNIITALSNINSEIDILIEKASKSSLIPILPRKEGMSPKTYDYLLKFGSTEKGTPIPDILKKFEGGRKPEEIYNRLFLKQADFVKLLKEEGEDVKDINKLWEAYSRDIVKRVNYNIQMNMLSEQSLLKAKKEADALKQKLADEQKLAEIESKRKSTADFLEKIRKKTLEVKSSFFEFAQSIKETDKQANILQETLNKVFYKKDIKDVIDEMVPNKLPKPVGADFTENLQEQEKNIKNATDANLRYTENIEKLNMALKRAAAEGLNEFAFGLEQVFNKEISFGDNLLRAVAKFAEAFGKQLILIGAGRIAVGDVAQGALAIAAGTALIGGAQYVQKGISSRMEKLSDARSISTTNYRNSNEIVVTGQLVGSGRDLVAVINNTQFDNSIRRGG